MCVNNYLGEDEESANNVGDGAAVSVSSCENQTNKGHEGDEDGEHVVRPDEARALQNVVHTHAHKLNSLSTPCDEDQRGRGRRR